jgi:protein gp37
MENSKIEWTDHTFNPWIGCTKIDEMCARCYAEVETFPRVQRANGRELWGKGKPRHRTSPNTWKQPLRWNAEAALLAAEELAKWYDGEPAKIIRPRVFCASMSDWLDDEVPIGWLADLLKLIHDTPNLDWLLLTKRPENFFTRLMEAMRYLVESASSPPESFTWEMCEWLQRWHSYNQPPTNVWIGTSVGTQKSANTRIPELLKIPARVRFLSCEPLLEGVDLRLKRNGHSLHRTIGEDIHWVICGGESGSDARAMHPDWARSLRDQCQAAGVPFFFKQWGEWVGICQQSAQAVRDAVGHAKMKESGKVHVWPNAKPLGPPHFGMNFSYRVGKKVAGRILDGREWSEFPKIGS